MTKKSALPSFDDIQAMLLNGETTQVAYLLHEHFLPSDDVMVNAAYADALRLEGRLDEALEVYRKAALAGGGHSVTLWRRIAMVQVELGDVDSALLSLRQALSLDPGDLELHRFAGQLLSSSSLDHQAVCHARHIFENSTDDEALSLAGNIFRFTMLPFEAYQVAKRRQEYSDAPDLYLSTVVCGAQGICEWETVAHLSHIIDTEYFAKGDFASVRETPLYNIARLADEAINYGVAKEATRHLEHTEPAFPLPHKKNGQEKIRIGLLSADFSEHPVIRLIIGLFETMDKNRFELFAFDDGKNNPDGERRMIEAMDKHIDVREQSDRVVAQKVYEEKIDILIDLMGLTSKKRQGVLALRPCPVTAVFLGFPGTCGLSKIDYIITDPIVTPDSSKPYYAEKLCRLPEVFMPNDNKREIAQNPVTRADVGLPEDAVVFCSFNRSFKLDEPTVSLWMRILARVPGSVLWQKGGEAHMRQVFLETAAKHGVDPSRIIFAGHMASVALHIKCAGLADLALDTLVYNGHTITSDMLWAGVPVITCKGTHFASRVSASLLHAVGLDDCITYNVQEMEELAVALACDPPRLAALKERLACNRRFMPLYDTERYTRHFETAMTMMLERAQQGLAPDHIDVPPLPPRCPVGENPEDHIFMQGGPPEVFEELATHHADGAYADTVADQRLQQTPYAIHFGSCPLCGKRAGTTGMPVPIAQNPLWQEPLPQKIFWITCPHCQHMHAKAFWDNEALEILRERTPAPTLSEKGFLQARTRLAPLVEYMWRDVFQAWNEQARPNWLIANAWSGDLALAAGCFGFSTTTVTLLPALQQALKEINHVAHLADIVLSHMAGQCSVLTLEALDRCPYPRLMLARAHAILDPGGLLHLPLNNFEPLAVQLAGTGDENKFLRDPRAYHMFSRTKILEILKDSGFNLETMFTDPATVVGMHYVARKSQSC